MTEKSPVYLFKVTLAPKKHPQYHSESIHIVAKDFPDAYAKVIVYLGECDIAMNPLEIHSIECEYEVNVGV